MGDGIGLECPWRFGDTLMFSVSQSDLLGPGLRLRLRGHSDLRLGPLQLELPASQGQLLGETVVSLRRRILPACVNVRRCDPDVDGPDGSYRIWESPVMVIPLGFAAGSLEVDADPFVAVAHVAVAFGVTADPDLLLQLAEDRQRPLVDRVVKPLVDFVTEPRAACCASSERAAKDTARSAASPPFPTLAQAALPTALPTKCPTAAAGTDHVGEGGLIAALDKSNVGGGGFTPDGWICHAAPNGRVFWHHTSLGAPPWDLPLTPRATIAGADLDSSPRLGPLSPDDSLTQVLDVSDGLAANVLPSVWEEAEGVGMAERHNRFKIRPFSLL